MKEQEEEKEKELVAKKKQRAELEEKIRKRRSELSTFQEVTTAQVKKVLKERPKYLQMEEKFIKEVEVPLLDQRKK